MKILVTGGTGVVGAGVVPELVHRGHHVRLLSRGAHKDVASFPEGVEPFRADVTEPQSLQGAADGCEAVVHITGIVEEKPPEATYHSVNVLGTRHMLAEAERAGVTRFIFMSSLGADRGLSDYHRSKLAAEHLVQQWPREWIILRPGNVYGPGDEVISMLLKLVRSLPAVPMVGRGEQRFQPLWFEDLGQAVAEVSQPGEFNREVLELAGEDITTTRDVIERLSEITQREPATLPVPTSLAAAAVRLAEESETLESWLERAGLTMPLSTAKLQMLLEENVVQPPEANALRRLLKAPPTPLDFGLVRLTDELPELLPDEGVGAMERKRFCADIHHTLHDARGMMTLFREHLPEIMLIEFSAEPGAPVAVVTGSTLTAAIPGRGHVQVRVAEATDTRVTFVTVEGHPLAGTVSFEAEEIARGTVRFSITINARAANIIDWIGMRTIGRIAQAANWRQVVQRMIEWSGGQSPEGVRSTSRALSDEEAERAMQRTAELVPVTS